MTTKEHWNAIFEKGQTLTSFSDKDLDLVLERCGRPKTALDIACGTGDLVVQLARRGITATGADISTVALNKAQEKLQSENLEADLVELDFNFPNFGEGLTGSYDIVFIRLAFAFVREKDLFLEEIKKLMAPGGTFVCTLPGLLPNVAYDTRQNNISLPKSDLERILGNHFSSVELVLEDLTLMRDWPLLTYLCR